MKLIFPNNVFATLLILSINERFRENVIIRDSSLLTNELLQDQNAVALIPSLDIMNQRELIVSSKFGIGFEGLLSNSYVYFGNNDNIEQIYLKGDVSSNDVILSKIVFQERYNIKPEIVLDTNNHYGGKTYIIGGNSNWENDKFREGTSLSEQISDLIEHPYINYVFAARKESTLKEFHSIISDVNDKIINSVDKNLEEIGLGVNINSFIKSEINSINYSFSDYDITSLKELFQMVYFYGMLDEMFDIKFIG